jgi:SAM-dependent methyltransferase
MERITQDNCVGPARYGHEFRYRLAAGFMNHDVRVLDAACGTGYGYEILYNICGCEDFWYLGVDKSYPDNQELNSNSVKIYFAEADLSTPWLPNWSFDIFLGFETIEHLASHDNYVNIAHQAGKWILVSAPVVPTRHLNPHHVHDFIPGQLREMFQNEDWEHYQTVQQPSELSEIVILRRRT